MNRQQNGFTLIELMVVVAIVGLLAAVALPLYRDYVIKTRVSEMLMATSPCRSAVSEHYQMGSVATPPGANGFACEVINPVATKYVATITTTQHGLIEVMTTGAAELGPAAARTITLIPQDALGGPFQWDPSYVGTQVAQFRCQAGGAAPMPGKYLPRTCV